MREGRRRERWEGREERRKEGRMDGFGEFKEAAVGTELNGWSGYLTLA